MLEDMHLRKLESKTRTGYMRAVRRLAELLERSPDTATAEDLRRLQWHLIDQGTAPITLNATLTGCEVARSNHLEINGAKVVVQGFGSVGLSAAGLFGQAGALIAAAQDHTGSAAADRLAERGILVVPDVICNAGGVTVSCFEWVQDTQWGASQAEHHVVQMSGIVYLAAEHARAASDLAATASSVEQVNAGGRPAADAGATMGKIVLQVKRVNDLIADVGVVADAQTQGIGQVSRSVASLNQRTQFNSALVEQSAAATGRLMDHAACLATAVRAFR